MGLTRDNLITPYWRLDGRFGDGRLVFWTNEPTGSWDVEPRMIGAPSPFKVGLGATMNGAPERTSLQVRLDNADGALTQFVIGTGIDAASEYQSSSFLDFKATLTYVGVTDTGTIRVLRTTPTLVLSGPVTVDGTVVSLTLAVDDEPLLGSSGAIRTVREYIDDPAAEVFHVDFYLAQRFDFPPDEYWWARFCAESREGLDISVPWIYGNRSQRALKVSSDSETFWVVGICGSDTYASIQAGWAGIRVVDGDEVRTVTEGLYPFVVKFSAREWLICLCGLPDFEPDGEVYFEVRERFAPAHPVDVIKDLLTDHATAGAAAFDAASLEACRRPLDRFIGAIAGAFGDSSSIGELFSHILPPLGLRAWIGIDDKLHFVATGATAAELASAGPLPELEASDDFPGDGEIPSWKETLPGDPEDPNAALSRIAIEYPDEIKRLFPAETSRIRTGIERETAVALAYSAELILSGAWLCPTLAGPTITEIMERTFFPTRLVELASHVSMISEPIGALWRLSNPAGLGGWNRRLARLISVQPRPQDQAAICFFEDLGPTEGLRGGKLDSLEEWVAVDPSKPSPITITIGTDGKVTTSGEAFEAEMVGATIWAMGAALEENRRSYRIKQVDDKKNAIVEDPPSAVTTIAAVAGPLIAARWLIMWTHESKPAHRADYIRAADLATGQLGNGDPAFRFLRH